MDADRDTQTVNTSIRLPARLHERLRREAERQDRTVHNLMLHYIRRGLDEDLYRDVDPFERAKLMQAREDERQDEDR
jgi:predicted DNA-binding protein